MKSVIGAFVLSLMLLSASSAQSSAGQALQFNGNGEFVRIPGNHAYAFGAGNFTIEMWINPTALDGDYKVLFVNNTLGNCQLNFSPYGNTLRFYAGGAGSMLESGSLSWQLGVWYHIAVSRISGTIKIYRDALEVATGITTNSVGDSTNIDIGFHTPSNHYPFSGMIDEVRVWNIGKT
jgi:hypothetical protein